MNADELQDRTRKFALRAIKLVDAMPTTTSARAIGNQLVRSGMSSAANYRAARRGRSRKEFVAKIGIVVEEIDESEFWLGLIMDAKMLPPKRVEPLRTEAEELTRIFARTRRTATQP